MPDLDATISAIVQKSFPELRPVHISCRVTDTAEDFLAGIQWSHTDPPQVVLTFSAEDLNQMSEAAVVGCLAHELCHAAYDLALSPSVFATNNQRYTSDPDFRSTHEREIDLAVIRKGYGRELLALQLYHNEHYDAYLATDGLTPEETERIISELTDT